MKILVYIDQRGNKMKGSALEALSQAAQLNGNPAEVAAFIAGDGIEAMAAELKGYGCDVVFTVSQPGLKDYNCLAYAKAFETAIREFSPGLVLGAATPTGRDLFPRLAARFDGAIASDVTALAVSGDDVKVSKPMYAGKVIAEQTLKGGCMRFVTLRPNVFAAHAAGKGAAQAKPLSVQAVDARLQTMEVRKGKSEKPDLAEAAVIISGGRALGNADNFKILHECANVIGATVGASRAAVDSGYASHDMQVGQTGKTVNPNLYIACGISGSIQHMAGMRTSKYIVAINTDADAPIFAIADYGIVADLFEAVPAMTKAFKSIVE